MDSANRTLTLVLVTAVLKQEIEIVDRSMPDQAAEQTHMRSVKELAKINRSACGRRPRARSKAWKNISNWVWSNTSVGEPAPSKADARVHIPKILARHKIF